MRSLAQKLTLAFLLVGLTGALLVAVVIRQRARAAFDQFILSREQQALVTHLVQYYAANGGWDGVGENLGPLLAAAPRASEGRRDFPRDWMHMTLVDVERTVVFSLRADQLGQVVARQDLERAVPLTVDRQPIGWLVLAPAPRQWIPSSPEGLFLRNLNTATRLSALVAAVLALLLGGFLAFTLTRTLRELTEATDEIARGQLGRQVQVRSHDELGELAASFNKMSLDLAQATRARRQMTADIAHDLRSPLSVIAGYAEALSDGKLPGTPEVYGILHQETIHLSRLVEDLRMLSLADAGELPLNRQPLHPGALLERVARRQAVAAGQHGVTLRVEAPGGLPPVSADAERLAQVFDNLVLNAFRYTRPGGEVVLAAHSSPGQVQLQVRDNGQGIDPADLPHIFNRFYRGDKARQQNGASGLGLAIARSIVEAHHGTIAVHSQPGQGATFTITLPIQAPAACGA